VAHPASYPMGTLDSFLGVEQLGNDADHSLPSSVQVKHGGAIPPFFHMFSWNDA
jgi:hypothetical protein